MIKTAAPTFEVTDRTLLTVFQTLVSYFATSMFKYLLNLVLLFSVQNSFKFAGIFGNARMKKSFRMTAV